MIFESIGAFMSKLMFFHGIVNEYNGFPKPLTSEEEENYLTALEHGDKKAREILINHNLRLVAHIAKKFSGTAEVDDLISVGSIGLIKAIDSYRLGKGSKLSTYASRCVENEILMLLRSNKKHNGVRSIEESVAMDNEGGELSIKDIIPQKAEDDPDNVVGRVVVMEKIKQVMREQLDEREYQIINLRYGIENGDEHTQREVAKIMNISRSYVSRIESKALEILKCNLHNI